MKIAFVTTYDAQDINSWSGTPFYMSKAFIDAGIKVEFIGNLKSPPKLFFFKLKNTLYNKIFKKRFGIYNSFYEPGSLKFLAQQVQKKIKNSDIDIILAPGAFPIAYLNTQKPIVLWTDATFAVMLNYYPGYSNFSKLTTRNCNLYEKNVLRRVQLGFFSSEWAAISAVRDYKIPSEKIKVLSYGANISGGRKVKDIPDLNDKKSKTICKLLFVGQDWERKGGNVAVNITRELNNRGINSELAVLGCTPISSSLPDYIKIFGFVDKSKEDGLSLINKLYCESHFFVLPTIADCTPIVFAEANSFGLPVITCNTGGIPSVIKNDVNGKMFDADLNVNECAGYIERLFTNFEKYKSLSLTSFNEYKAKLNWEVSVAQMIPHLENILNNSRGHAQPYR